MQERIYELELKYKYFYLKIFKIFVFNYFDIDNSILFFYGNTKIQ
ncbi:hypothetical protein C414_000390033 [Campylobacter jejuni subsp. jejuni 414]|nr:hypothetical protein C414_000390033 [Campylobacter jejuni subsp. jejuni 414]